jgi:hypothetical protein
LKDADMSDVTPPDSLTMELTRSSIWNVPAVSDQPGIAIVRWRVLQTEVGSRHLVGFNSDDAEGRVSTAIAGFDAAKRTVTTASGRLYKLVGPSGYDSDADWVWGLWSRRNKVGNVVDVSSFYEEDMDASKAT